MTNKISILLIVLSFGFIACNSNVVDEETDNKETKNEELIEALITKINSPDNFGEIWRKLPIKRTPVIDTTNFDNIENIKEFNAEEIKLFQLIEIYPNIEKEGYDYRFLPSYKLELSDDFYTIVLNIFTGDHELETVLINYNLKEELTAYKVIAYDEIAEGWSRKHSKTENNIITVIDEFYRENTQIDTTKFHMNKYGEINQIKTKFSSSIRPDKAIVLNQIYTDTIEFLTYDDNGDYYLLIGKKNGKEVSLVYSWDWQNNNKFNFQYGDSITVKWKMDSIFYAGDGETLDFTERVMDAENILFEKSDTLISNNGFENNTHYSISVEKINSVKYNSEKQKHKTLDEKIIKITDFNKVKKRLEGVVEFANNDDIEENQAIRKIHFRNGNKSINLDERICGFIAYYPDEDILLCEGGHSMDISFNLKNGKETEETGNPDLIIVSPKKGFRLNGSFGGQECYSYFIQRKINNEYVKIIQLDTAFEKLTKVWLCTIGESFWMNENTLYLTETDFGKNKISNQFFKIEISF